MRKRMISDRAFRWASRDPYLVKAHFACARDPFDPENNPNGFINFGTAENHEVFDTISGLLRESCEIWEKDTHYNELHGALFLREAIADFLSTRAGRPLSADNIALASGASAVLEILAFVLCDPGDAILIPAPHYPGFDRDLALRSEAHLVQIPLGSPEFRLSISDVERAYSAAVSQGVKVCGILLNSPQNPLGRVYDEEVIRGVIDFASGRDLHVILDEIYAESLQPGVEHFTGLRVQSPHVHVVYGFAKDFGLSGYKVGILHSENADVIKAVRDSTYFHTVSMIAQRALAGVLRSERLGQFLDLMRERLAASYRHTTGELSGMGIPFVPVQGGIVLWLDLRSFLPSASFEGERTLWNDIFNNHRVSISPGMAFHCVEPGWFRLCFTIPQPHRNEGLRRMGDYLTSCPS